jgi:D-beta-D-heptose 7-phosphate kinase/D-beta-D-heptose 1-phosphate adenosyltransferase
MKFLVIGDCCEDVYIYGKCTRLCPEGPVPVLDLDLEKTVITNGMAGNVANNIKAMGHECDLICNEIKCKKIRYIDQESNQIIIRVDETNKEPEMLVREQLPDLHLYNGVIVSDYNKGFVSSPLAEYISKNHPITFLDSKKIMGEWSNHFTVIKLNREEYLSNRTYIDNRKGKSVVTLGSKGCKMDGRMYPPKSVLRSFDVSGAGDTFVAAFTVRYAEKNTMEECIDFAQKCCFNVIAKKGTATI